MPASRSSQSVPTPARMETASLRNRACTSSTTAPAATVAQPAERKAGARKATKMQPGRCCSMAWTKGGGRVTRSTA
jgi:hypothetical protein